MVERVRAIEKKDGSAKRIMRAFKISELSAVDRPAQQHAKMTLMKRGVSESNDLDKGEDVMDRNQITIEDVQKNLDAEVKKVADLTAKLDKAEKVAGDAIDQIKALKSDLETAKAAAEEATAKAKAYAEMTEDERMAADAMDEEAKKKFVAMSKADRKKHLTDLMKNDEVLKVDGVGEIRKSQVGAESFAVFKAQQERIEKAEKTAAEQAAIAKKAELTKRAGEEEFIKSYSGTVDEKVAVLAAMEKMDEPARKSLTTMLTAGAKAIAGAFGTIGHRGQGNGDIGKNADGGEFMKKVNAIKSADKCSHQEAMQKARSEYPDLFKAYQGQDAAN